MASVRRTQALMLLVLLVVPGGPRTAAADSPSVVETIPVGANPLGVAVDSEANKVFVANFGGNSVTVIDAATHTVEATIPIGRPKSFSVDSVRHRLYVSGGPGLAMIDTETNAILRTAGVDAWDVAVNPITRLIYTTNEAYPGAVQVFDADTLEVVVERICLIPGCWGVSGNPRGIVVNAQTNKIYVAVRGDRSIKVIDGSRNVLEGSIPLDGGLNDVAVDPTDNTIYVAGFGEAWAIDGATETVRWNVSTSPWGGEFVDIHPRTKKVYISGYCDQCRVSVIDSLSATVTAVARAGQYPAGIAINPSSDLVYVANYLARTVTVLTDPPITTFKAPYSSRCATETREIGLGAFARADSDPSSGGVSLEVIAPPGAVSGAGASGGVEAIYTAPSAGAVEIRADFRVSGREYGAAGELSVLSVGKAEVKNVVFLEVSSNRGTQRKEITFGGIDVDILADYHDYSDLELSVSQEFAVDPETISPMTICAGVSTSPGAFLVGKAGSVFFASVSRIAVTLL